MDNEDSYNQYTEYDRKLGDGDNKSNNIIDDLEKIIGGLNQHLKETDCEHCKDVLRKIFSK